MPSKTQYKRVLLTSVSDEFKEVEKLFKKSMRRSVEIIGIERVQNPFMWEKYQRYLIQYSTPKVNKTQRKLVYVIGLHAVQFGNNWMRKFRGLPNWTRP